MNKKNIYEKDGKLFFKLRKCPICDRDSYISGEGKNFIELSCIEHPNWIHIITEELIF